MSSRCMSHDSFSDLISESPDAILDYLNNVKNGFHDFVCKDQYNERDIDIAVQIIARACESKRLGSLQRLLKLLCVKDEKFISQVYTAIQKIHFGHHSIKLPRLIECYAVILEQLLTRLERYSTIESILPLLKKIVKMMKDMGLPVTSAKMMLQKLEGMCVSHWKALEFADGKVDQEDFRELSIFPRSSDMYIESSYLRENRIEGSYLNVDDYLDVQFRLMREDMVRTFRENITQFKTRKITQNVFKNVTVSYPPRYTTKGICHNISFQSDKAIDWKARKRLIPGSLVCLSSDNFHTIMIFATVIERRVADGPQTKCKLQIVIEEPENVEHDIDHNNKYVMIETSAYFESYRHVLTVLKKFNENNLPFADYLVYLKFDKLFPDFLQDVEFCLHEKCGAEKKEEGDDCRVFQATQLNDWPTGAELKLDGFQYKAYRAASTHRLGLIQGPPGTGKTYLGVKIVKTILENTRKTPIVICCVTNHALDQFLERLLVHTKKIIRLGGQSEMNVLKPHVLFNIKQALRYIRLGEDIDPNNHVLSEACALLKELSSDITKIAPSLMYDEYFFKLRESADKMNKLINILFVCVNDCMNDNALNEILSLSFKKTLCQEDNRENALNCNMKKWLDAQSNEEIYERMQIHSNVTIPEKNPNSKNIWGINSKERYRLFQIWKQICIENVKNRIRKELEYYLNLLQQCTKPLDFDECMIVEKADIIGLTMTGAAKFNELLCYIKPKIMIVEEAAEALEAHLITSLVPSIEQLILIGDHKQLRPIPATHELEKKFNLSVSLFERLFINNAPSSTLVTQHRMRPCIADLLVPDIYQQLDSHQSVREYENILGTPKNLFFLDHNKRENCRSSLSVSNAFEVSVILNLALYFTNQGYTLSQITILAMYGEQVLLLHEKAKEMDMEFHITTVDNYQGEENDIILISFVRSNEEGNIGFLKESNRVCVALSRARKGLYCVGNFGMLARASSLFDSIVVKLMSQNMIGLNFPLQCRCHGRVINVGEIEEFNDFSDKGCMGACGYELPCGHVCTKRCHFNDLEHKLYKCQMPCDKEITHPKNNVTVQCKRLCWQPCHSKKRKVKLPCGHDARINFNEEPDIYVKCLVECEIMFSCGHFNKVPCSDQNKGVCSALVPVILPCGHKKSVPCTERYELRNIVCDDFVPLLAPCGHTVEVPCVLPSDSDTLSTLCKRPCESLLNCGHACVGSCSWCFNFKIHPMCLSKCSRKLQCGHDCKGLCASPCLPCKSKCLCQCDHSHCINPCNRPCVRCMEPCARACQHQKCTLPCHVKCEVPPCTKRCTEILPCGHACIGLCNDPCPVLCRVCHRSELKSSDPDNDSYVLLENCEHLFEVVELTSRIEDQISSFQWPSCPQCGMSIMKSKRFSDQLKAFKKISTTASMEEDIAEIEYLFHTCYGTDNVTPWRFRKIQKTIKSMMEDVPTENVLSILKSFLKDIPRLVYLSNKLDYPHENAEKFDTLIMWMHDHLKSVSYQQLDELEYVIAELEANVK